MDGQNKPPLVLFAKMFDIIGKIKRKKKNPMNLLTWAFLKTSVKSIKSKSEVLMVMRERAKRETWWLQDRPSSKTSKSFRKSSFLTGIPMCLVFTCFHWGENKKPAYITWVFYLHPSFRKHSLKSISSGAEYIYGLMHNKIGWRKVKTCRFSSWNWLCGSA
jgi:hypothetical protein